MKKTKFCCRKWLMDDFLYKQVTCWLHWKLDVKFKYCDDAKKKKKWVSQIQALKGMILTCDFWCLPILQRCSQSVGSHREVWPWILVEGFPIKLKHGWMMVNDGEWWWMGAFKIWWTLNLQSDDSPSKKLAIWRGFGWVTVQFTPENSLGPKRTSSIHGFSDGYVSLGVDNSWKLPLKVWDWKSTQFSQKITNHRMDRNSQNQLHNKAFCDFQSHHFLKPKKKKWHQVWPSHLRPKTT